MVGVLLTQLQESLSKVSETPALDGQVVLAWRLQRPRSWILAHPEAVLTPLQLESVQRAVEQLESGEPLPYCLGHWEFYGLDFEVSPGVLIPRPETELLVEQALRWLEAHPGQRWAADVGTGSGCIAVALAAHRLDLQALATDLSPFVLPIAHRNITRHHLDRRIFLVQADLLAPVYRKFDLICANLPYVPSETARTLRVARWEPQLALNGGPDGLNVIRRLLHQAPERLASDGLMLLEIEASQGKQAVSLAQQAFPGAQARLLQDLAGLDRLVVIENSEGA